MSRNCSPFKDVSSLLNFTLLTALSNKATITSTLLAISFSLRDLVQGGILLPKINVIAKLKMVVILCLSSEFYTFDFKSVKDAVLECYDKFDNKVYFYNALYTHTTNCKIQYLKK